MNAENAKLVVKKLFAGSPRDVIKQRSSGIRKVVAEVNDIAKSRGYFIDVVEGDMVPLDAGDPQKMILKYVGKFDIFVGIMGQRIGSPTARGVPGTLEELDRAIERKKRNSRVRIMFYFNTGGAPGDLARWEDYKKVLLFKKQLEKRALVRDYVEHEEFLDLFRNDLQKTVLEWEDLTAITPPDVVPFTGEKTFRCPYWEVWQHAFNRERRQNWRTEWHLFEKARSSIKFMTISGRSISSTPVEDMLRRKACEGEFTFKLLLFDWNSPWVKSKMQDERRATDDLINGARQRAVGIARSYLALAGDRLKLEIKLHKDYPVWRMVIVDAALAYVGYYPREKRGYEGPMYVLKRQDTPGLFYPMNQYFDMLWASSGKRLSNVNDSRFELRPLQEICPT